MNEQEILSITRPHPRLLTLYIIRSILSGPGIVFALPMSLFRYYTMEYKFDPAGLTMSWGFFFKRQTTLSYSRIQDIHLENGIIQRWLGLADIQIQTASGSAEAEIVIEGILEYESVRNFLYTRMRGYKDLTTRQPQAQAMPAQVEASGENAILKAIADELAGARAAAERLAAKGQANV